MVVRFLTLISVLFFMHLFCCAQKYQTLIDRIAQIKTEAPNIQVSKYQKIKDSLTKTDTPDSIMALVYHRLGWAYHLQDDNNNSLYYTELAYSMRGNSLPTMHIDIAHSAYNLGLIYQSQAAYKKSIFFL